MEYVMRQAQEFVSQFQPNVILICFGAITFLFVLYYMIRHLILGIGRSTRTVNRMRDALNDLPVDRDKVCRCLDKLEKDRVTDEMWKKVYAACYYKKDVQAGSLVSYRFISTLSGFSHSLLTVLLLSVVTVCAMFCCGYSLPLVYQVLAIGVLGMLVIIFMACLLRSGAGKAVCILRSSLIVCLSEVKREDNTRLVADMLAEKLDQLNAGLAAKETAPAPVRGGKDLEIQILESMMNACLRKMDADSGARFAELNAALDRSIAAQYRLIERINLFLKEHE